MFTKVHIFSRSSLSLQNILHQRPVHYQIGKNGEKIVVSQRHNVKSDRERWQNVEYMGKEPEVRQIMRIEKDDRLHSVSKEARMTAKSKMDKLKAKLEVSGFCRDRKSYDPPADFSSRFQTLSQSILSTTSDTFSLSDPKQKFKFLTALIEEFDHEVSNSQIFTMKTVGDVKDYYSTPVRGRNSYDQMVAQQPSLPRNLHVLPEPIRFNPETDKFFGGVDAYPGPSFELPGLRARKRYEQKPDRFEWPDI